MESSSAVPSASCAILASVSFRSFTQPLGMRIPVYRYIYIIYTHTGNSKGSVKWRIVNWYNMLATPPKSGVHNILDSGALGKEWLNIKFQAHIVLQFSGLSLKQ